MRDSIDNVLNSFGSIALTEMDRVKFLKRCDFKYVLSLDKLVDILQEVEEYYNVMLINNRRNQGYKTTYFDTEDDSFYLAHHGGRNNRFKVRKREYRSTNERFFEVKKKNLMGQTQKKRIKILSETNEDIDDLELSFMAGIIPRSLPRLERKIDTMFNRITLVSKELNERVTIDLDLSFLGGNGDLIETENFTVIEVKYDKHAEKTVIQKALKKHGIRTTGFSKYCIGRALTSQTLKSNQFKQKLKLIKKYCQPTTNHDIRKN